MFRPISMTGLRRADRGQIAGGIASTRPRAVGHMGRWLTLRGRFRGERLPTRKGQALSHRPKPPVADRRVRADRQSLADIHKLAEAKVGFPKV